jgi:hypothetical protein
MLWALLARLITRQPPLFQAVVLGLCVGLFVTAGAQANTRDTVVEKAVLQTAVAGVIAATLFYLGLLRSRRQPDRVGADWRDGVYVMVWLLGSAAAVMALFGQGGLKVAALAIVPLVLLAAPALQGFRLILGRGWE